MTDGRAEHREPGKVDLSRAWLTQCALSRICGGCGEGLGRPIAFVATDEEVARNAMHAPPMHLACAERSLQADPTYQRVVTTAGFEFERPNREDRDQRVRFVPNSLIG